MIYFKGEVMYYLYSWWIWRLTHSLYQGARCSSVVKSVRTWCDGLLDHSFMVNPLSYFSFQPVLHDWCNKGYDMCYPVCGMVQLKEPLLLIGKSSPCGNSRFPLSLSEWSLSICPMPYKCKWNMLSASLNKIFPSFLLSVITPHANMVIYQILFGGIHPIHLEKIYWISLEIQPNICHPYW